MIRLHFLCVPLRLEHCWFPPFLTPCGVARDTRPYLAFSNSICMLSLPFDEVFQSFSQIAMFVSVNHCVPCYHGSWPLLLWSFLKWDKGDYLEDCVSSGQLFFKEMREEQCSKFVIA